MKKHLLLLLLCVPVISRAQYEFSTFTATGRGGATTFATDYQCLGINPANLGWEFKFGGKKMAVGGPELAFSLHSMALTKSELRDVFRQTLSGNYDELTYNEKMNAARDFTTTGFAFNASLGSMGYAFMHPKAGGFAFRMNDNIQWFSKLGDKAADLFFLGKTAGYFDSLVVYLNGQVQTIANPNTTGGDLPSTIDPDSVISGFSSVPLPISKLMADSKITLSWTRDYNFSYGRRIFGDSTLALFAGIGFKYVQGLGYVDIVSDNAGKMTAFSSLSPIFGIEYDSSATLTANVVESSGGRFRDAFRQVGKGYGIDFGVNVIIKNKLKLGVSLINMGKVTWSGNVYTVKDTLVLNTTNPGLDNYNVAAQLDEILGEKGIMEMEGKEERVTKLPNVLRGGASLVIGKFLEVGVDAIVPLNDEPGSFEKAIIGFGGDVKPLPWLKLQAGFVTGGNYDFQIPVGMVITTKGGTYEMGIASRDAITFFAKNGPVISLAMGFMRFRF